MSRPISWWRMYRGKVWHVALAGDLVAVCGAMAEDSPEMCEGVPPMNARLCEACGTAVEVLGSVVRAVADSDPRRAVPRLVPVEPEPWHFDPGGILPGPAADVAPAVIWSAVAIWKQLLAETDGAPFSAETYASWVLREYLNPWGMPGDGWPFRTRELVAA